MWQSNQASTLSFPTLDQKPRTNQKIQAKLRFCIATRQRAQKPTQKYPKALNLSKLSNPRPETLLVFVLLYPISPTKRNYCRGVQFCLGCGIVYPFLPAPGYKAEKVWQSNQASTLSFPTLDQKPRTNQKIQAKLRFCIATRQRAHKPTQKYPKALNLSKLSNPRPETLLVFVLLYPISPTK